MLSVINVQETDSLCFFFLPTLELTTTIDIYSAVQEVGPETPQQAIPGLLQETEPRHQAAWWVLQSSQRRLAWHLLGCGPERLTWKDLGAALYSPQARLQRAQHLLRYAEQQEYIGRQEAAAAVWGWVDEEWHWVATAPVVKRRLIERARGLGMPEPEALAQVVLDAVTGELLPILHLKWYLLSLTSKETATRRAPHQAFLTNWQVSAGATEGLAEVYLWYLRAQTEKLATSSDRITENVAAFLEKGKITIQIADRLVDALTQSMAAWLPAWISAQPDLKQIDHQLYILRRVEQAGPPTVALMELRSLLYLLRGSKQSTMPAAIVDLSRALSYDPFNRQAQEQWRYLEEEVRDLRQRLPTLDVREQVTARRLLESTEKSLQEAVYFVETPQGQQIMERRQQAVRAELARRLGLVPHGEHTAEILDGLATCLRESSHLANDAEAFSVHVRQVAEARGGLMALDWERIEATLQEAPIPNEGILALLLPRSASISLDESLATAQEAVRESRARATAMPEPGSRRLAIGTWLFSPRDLVVKLAAIAGMVLCLHGGVVTTADVLRDRAVDRAYTNVLAGLQGGDDKAIIAHALDYLERVDTDLKQPRTPQIIGFLREAVLGEVIRLGHTGADEAAAALLERFEQTTERFPKLADNLHGRAKEGGK